VQCHAHLERGGDGGHRLGFDPGGVHADHAHGVGRVLAGQVARQRVLHAMYAFAGLLLLLHSVHAKLIQIAPAGTALQGRC
jgi:hypothetical protein